MSAMATTTLALLAWLAVGALAEPVNFTLVHFNDNHARFEPADTNFGSGCEGTDADACFGGFARQSTAIKAAQAADAATDRDTLVLFAGDQYSGTVWGVVYEARGIQVAPAFLEELGVQAMTLGNHEFDDGVANLADFIRNASFPVLSCNLDTSAEPLLDGLVEPYTIVELPRSGLRVGVVGLTTVETPEASSPGPNLRFLPYNDTLPGCVAAARADGAQLVVALTHIGYSDDVALAGSPAAADVDLFVGGHTHTLLNGAPPPVGEPQVGEPVGLILTSPPTNESTEVLGPYPTLVAAAGGEKEIPVVQAMWASRYLGVLDVAADTELGLLLASGAPLLLGGANSTNPVPDDAVVAAEIAALRGPIDELASSVVGFSLVRLDGERAAVRGGETNLGNLICDSLLWYVETSTGVLRQNGGVPAVCLVNGGGIRASIEAGNVTASDLNTVDPFGNWLVVKRISGATMTAALNSGLSGWTGDDEAEGRFPQVGNVRYAFDPTLPADSRLVAAEVLLPDGTAAPLEQYADQSILLVTNNFVAEGGDDYNVFAGEPLLLDSSVPTVQITTSYFENFSPIDTQVDGRIANCLLEPAAPLCASEDTVPAAAEAPAAVPAASGTLGAGLRGGCAAGVAVLLAATLFM